MLTHIVDHRPPRIAFLLLIVAAAVHWLLPPLSRQVASLPVLGVVLFLGGFSAMMWAWWLFKSHRVAICPTSPTARLLTSGIYRFTRNPMYLGIVMMLLGIALYVGSLPFYLAAGAFFAVVNFAFCPFEEAKLSRSFGAEYLNYRAMVRRWL